MEMKKAIYIWWCLLLSGTALGQAVDCSQVSLARSINGLSDSVFFYEQRLYAPGDYGSRNWRIPALCTLEDGTLLAVNDKRKHNEGDLPQDIDIVCRRSTDGGRTWTPPETIVEGMGIKKGFGDPALVVCENGEVVLAFVGGNGVFASTEEDPISTYVCRSSDGGRTWSLPEDITWILWGSCAVNPACRSYRGSFCASGNGLRLRRGAHRGRILFAAAMRRNDAWALDNFVLYSDDNGHSWQVSEKAFAGGDEAKLIELVDGRVLMSVRQNGARGHTVSADGGVTWSPQGFWPEMTTNACNGDMLRLCATDEGGQQNVILHSIPNSMEREDVSVFVSHDEGRTWHSPVRLCQGPSVYSSLTLLTDGTIGCFVEKNTPDGCELWYQNFTYAWLLQNIK